mmetsp:Transcript_22802/g.74448  ORF Transcript_22802/g.74448 Transcript_22802/m.74448 type:complete len:110 (-) Transcript_22802:1538-1867(-)
MRQRFVAEDNSQEAKDEFVKLSEQNPEDKVCQLHVSSCSDRCPQAVQQLLATTRKRQKEQDAKVTILLLHFLLTNSPDERQSRSSPRCLGDPSRIHVGAVRTLSFCKLI